MRLSTVDDYVYYKFPLCMRAHRNEPHSLSQCAFSSSPIALCVYSLTFSHAKLWWDAPALGCGRRVIPLLIIYKDLRVEPEWRQGDAWDV